MGQWIQKASMPTPRHDLQAITVGNQIYAISGGGDLTSDVVEIYDVKTDTWSQGPPIPTKRGWFGAVLLNQKIYTIAGKTIRSEDEKARTGDPANYDIRDSVEVLDLTSQTWASLQPIAAPRAGLAATLCKGKIYAIGGNAMNNEIRTGGPHLDTVEIYDPQRDHWSPGIPIPTPLQGPAVATMDNRIYITAGIGGTERKPNSNTYVFDPDVGKWEQLAPIPTPRCDPGSLVVDRKIYTFGGWGNGGYYDNVEIYDIDADCWTFETPLPEKKAWMATALVQKRIFVMGGAYRLADDSGYKWIDDMHELVT